MSNLNSLRKLISNAMRDGHKTVTIPLDNASMIIVEYEKHRVAAKEAIDSKKEIMAAVDNMASDYKDAIDNLALDGFEEEAEESYELLKAYRAARGTQ